MTRTSIRIASHQKLAAGRFVAVACVILALTSCASQPTAVQPSPTADVRSSPTAEESHAPVEAVDLAAGEQDAPVDVAVSGDDGVGVTFREITLAPGATTGVHCHYGQLIAVVSEGSLTHYADIYPSGVHVYEAGDSIIEGAGYRHEGRNEGDENVVLWVTYIIPEGKPLAETDLSHCDA